VCHQTSAPSCQPHACAPAPPPDSTAQHSVTQRSTWHNTLVSQARSGWS
jgi:hypothetical protein